MNEQQDRAIARGLRDGKPEAWRTLYDCYCEQIWRAAARGIGANSADIADVVQETFLAAARSAGGFDPQRGSLWAWLCGILRNQIALHFRKIQRRERIGDLANHAGLRNGQISRWLDGGEPLPAEVMETAELATIVRATLGELTGDYGTLLTAKYLDEATVAEIADREQTSATAVRSKLARARRAFRDTFDRITAGSPVNKAGKSERDD